MNEKERDNNCGDIRIATRSLIQTVGSDSRQFAVSSSPPASIARMNRIRSARSITRIKVPNMKVIKRFLKEAIERLAARCSSYRFLAGSPCCSGPRSDRDVIRGRAATQSASGKEGSVSPSLAETTQREIEADLDVQLVLLQDKESPVGAPDGVGIRPAGPVCVLEFSSARGRSEQMA